MLAIGNYIALGLDTIQGIVFVPLYLLYLNNRLYGLWLATGGIVAILSFLDMGIATLTVQRISTEYGKNNLEKVGLYFFNGILVQFVFMIVLFFIGLLLTIFLDEIIPINDVELAQLSKPLLVAIIALILSILNNALEGALNALQKPLVGKFTQIIGSFLAIIVTYIMLVNGFSILSISMGLLVRSVFSIVPNFIFIKLLFKKNAITSLRFDLAATKDYLSVSPSLFISKLGNAMVGNIEPTLLTMFVSPEVTVYYSITAKAGNLVKSVFERIAGILYPSLAHLYSCRAEIKYNNIMVLLLQSLIPLSLSCFLLYFACNRQFVTIWVGANNYLGDMITFLIAMSMVLSLFSNSISYLLGTTGDLVYPAWLVFLESATRLVMLFVLVQIFGIYGLPVAVSFTSLIFILLYCFRWKRHLNLSHHEVLINAKKSAKSVVAIAIITFIFYTLVAKFNISSWLYLVIAICLGGLSYLAVNVNVMKTIYSLNSRP